MTVAAPRKPKKEAPPKQRRNWVGYGLAALLIVVVAGLGLWWFGLRDTGGPVQTVEDSIAALNEGDVSAALEAYAADVTPEDLSLPTVSTQTVREFFEYNQVLNEGSTIVEACEEYVPDIVRCTLRHEDDLMRPANVAAVFGHTYRFNDDGLIRQEVVSGDGAGAYLSFYGTYAVWLGEAYPDAFEQVFGQGRPLMTAETAPILLEHIDEFVAQSTIYPLS